MAIKKLHDELKTTLSLELPHKHPEAEANEVLAKNAFAPFNMLAISKTRLEKVGTHEELGNIYLFSNGKKPDSNMFMYVDKLKMYGGAGKLSQKDKMIGLVETGGLDNILTHFKDGMQGVDEVSLYIPKSITKIIKGISAKHGLNDLVEFTFVESGIKTYAEKDSSMINMLHNADVDPKLIGHGFSQSGIKSLKAGVWQLIGDTVFDYERNKTFLTASQRTELKGVDLPAEHITLSASTVSKLMKFATKSADKNNYKTVLNYMLLDVQDGKGKFVSTDTRRLAVSNEFDVKGADGKYYIHPAHLSDNPKSVKVGGMVTEIEFDNYTYKQEIEHDPNFPEYQRIVPMNMRNSIEVETKELKDIKDEVVLAIKDGKAYIHTMKENEDFEEAVIDNMKPLKTNNISASDVFVVLESKYLKDAIDGSNTVTISINNKDVPVLVDGEQGLTVIMPVLYKTAEEKREAELKKQNRQNEYEASRKAREEAEAKQEAEELERLKKEDGIAHGWLNTLPPMQRGRARKTLSKLIRVDGEVMKQSEYIKKLVDEGREFRQKTYTPYNSSTEKTVWGAFDSENSWSEITATEAKLGQYLQINKG